MGLPQWNPYGVYGQGNNGQPQIGTFYSGRTYPNSGNGQSQWYGSGLGAQPSAPPAASAAGLGAPDFWSQVGQAYQQITGKGPGDNIYNHGNFPAIDPMGFSNLTRYVGSIYGGGYNGGVSPDQQAALQQKLAAAQASGFKGTLTPNHNMPTGPVGVGSYSGPSNYQPNYGGFGPVGQAGPGAQSFSAPRPAQPQGLGSGMMFRNYGTGSQWY